MEKQPTSRTCFMCGRQNHIGLQMTWYNDYRAQQIKAEVTVPEHFNGYPGVVHGGIVAAILDETSGRSLMLNRAFEEMFITTKLEVKYHQPTPTDQPLTVTGWIVKRFSRFARVAADIRLADGSLCAECEATVARPPRKFMELSGWEKEKQHWRVDE
ncbi:MAG: PaaI family thioesterase [Syntrophomonas sp.]|nr:PaaI family thioesterase [Syntrophomonas sp.]